MHILYIFGVPLGWVMWAIYNFVVRDYGWALVLFIVLTRVLLFPLGVKQQKSTAKMAAFQPKLQRLQKQYSNNKARYQEEMMKLYEKEGVSPTGGCLPSLIQMILLFGVIDVIYKPLTHLFHVSSSAITAAEKILTGGSTHVGNIMSSTPELQIITQIQNGHAAVYTNALGSDMVNQIRHFNMNFLGMNLGDIPNKVWGVLILIPILSFVSQVIFTVISLQQQKQNGMPQQNSMKWFMLLMPLMSLYFAFVMPAGIGLYWTISNVLMIVQQLLVQKMYPPEKVAAMEDKSSARMRERMKKRREKMETLNQQIAAKGIDVEDNTKKTASEPAESLSEKEETQKRLADARKRMAEKYGDDYRES